MSLLINLSCGGLAKHFLLDAKRTKDANSRQSSGKLVHLSSSLTS